MSKKILILSASPRVGGNSDMMADAFAEGAKEAGHEAVRFDTGRMKIGSCIACDKCWSKGNACVFNDDFQKIEPELESADVIVFSTPLYWFTFPHQIKGVIDKFYAYGGSGGLRPMTIKESYLMVCGEGEQDDADEYQHLVGAYRMTSDYLDWTDKGVLVQGGVGARGDIENTKALDEARQMGKTI